MLPVRGGAPNLRKVLVGTLVCLLLVFLATGGNNDDDAPEAIAADSAESADDDETAADDAVPPDRRASFGSGLAVKRSSIVYLTQSGAPLPAHLRFLKTESSDVINLNYAYESPSSQWSQEIYYPNSTFASGRNWLFETAKRREAEQGWRYHYVAFIDDDCRPTPLDNYADFLEFLFSYEPAVGVMRVSGIPRDSQGDILAVYNFDNIFVAFHREAIDYILPYDTKYDEEAPYAAELGIVHRSALWYRNHVLEYSRIEAKNDVESGRFRPPEQRVLRKIETEIKLSFPDQMHACFHSINDARSSANWGHPAKKSSTYAFPPDVSRLPYKTAQCRARSERRVAIKVS